METGFVFELFGEVVPDSLKRPTSIPGFDDLGQVRSHAITRPSGERREFVSHWRPSQRLRRHSRQMDRYMARCEKVTKGHHSPFGHERRYDWDVRQEYRQLRREEDAEHNRRSEALCGLSNVDVQIS